MQYKLLLLDVDGVLVKSKDDPISQKVIESIHQIKDSIPISLCTGRAYKYLKDIIDILGIKRSYHIIESGAKVLNPQGQEENVKDISFTEVKNVIEVAEDIPAGYGFCINGEWYPDIKGAENGQVTTVSFHSHSQKQTKEILEKIKPLKSKYRIAVGSHWEIPEGNFIIITNLEASKGLAIEYVQKKIGVSVEETIGVGDMPNDLPLFERSGLKVAMGNAHEELKKKADYISPPIEKDGVATVVKKFLLNQVPT